MNEENEEDYEEEEEKKYYEKDLRHPYKKYLKILLVIVLIFIILTVASILARNQEDIPTLDQSEVCRRIGIICEKDDIPCRYSCECARYCIKENREYSRYNYVSDKCWCIQDGSEIQRW